MKVKRSAKIHRLLFLISHITFFIYCFLFGWTYIILSLLTGLLAYNLSVQLFMHRSISHGHFSFSKTVKKVLCILFSFCNFGSLAVNCAIHTEHHRHSDTEKDPHNFRNIGIWRTLMKDWDSRNLPSPKAYCFYFADETLLYQHRHNLNYAIFSSIFLPFIPVCSFWLINLLFIIAHLEGSPSNIPILFPLMWGEEFHQDHHKYPGRKKLHSFDFMWFLGILFSDRSSSK